VSFTAPSQCTTATSNLVLLAVGVALPLSFILWLLFRARRHRRWASDLSEEAAVISGRVVLDDGVEDPVTVRVTQRRESNGWWSETRRETNARPFSILTQDGKNLRIEPSKPICFVAELDGFDPIDLGGDVRRRNATLAAGQEVHVCGTLVRDTEPAAGPYRNGGGHIAVRPRPGRPMLISKEPLARVGSRAALRYLNCALVTLVVFCLAHATLFLDYYVLQLSGHVVTAQVSPTHHRPSIGFDIWPVFVTTPDGTTFDEDDSEDLYHAVEAGRAPAVDLLTVGPYHQVGTQPTQGIRKLIVFAVSALGFVMLCLIYLHSSRPWWEGTRVVDRTEANGARSDIRRSI
jgi:hypothetical protein